MARRNEQDMTQIGNTRMRGVISSSLYDIN